MFGKDKLKKFLLIGFLGNFLLIVLLLTIMLFKIYDMQQETLSKHHVVTNAAERVEIAKMLYSIDLNLTNWQKMSKQHMLSTDSQEMSDFVNRIKTTKENLYSNINKLQNLIKQNKSIVKDLETIKKKVQKYDQYNQQVISLSKKNDKLTARTLSRTDSHLAYLSAETGIKKLEAKNIKEQFKETSTGIQMYSQRLNELNLMLISISIIGVMAIAISIILGIVSIKEITESYTVCSESEKQLSIQNLELLKIEKELKEQTVAVISAKEELEYKNRELIIINKSLRELDEMKSNFISTVSHELRTPLTSIKGSLSLILNDMVGEIDDHSRSFLKICHRNTDRLIRLINELLDISKIESGEITLNKKEMNLLTTVQDSIEGIMTYACENNVEIICDIHNEIMIYADQDRLSQVLYNLLSNGIKFSSKCDAKNGQVLINAYEENNYIVVKVNDNGIGIPEEQHLNVFDKFTQVDNSSTRAANGTGLGLAISKAIIEEHKGRIWVENNNFGGATIAFSIAQQNIQEIINPDALSPGY